MKWMKVDDFMFSGCRTLRHVRGTNVRFRLAKQEAVECVNLVHWEIGRGSMNQLAPRLGVSTRLKVVQLLIPILIPFKISVDLKINVLLFQKRGYVPSRSNQINIKCYRKIINLKENALIRKSIDIIICFTYEKNYWKTMSKSTCHHRISSIFENRISFSIQDF